MISIRDRIIVNERQVRCELSSELLTNLRLNVSRSAFQSFFGGGLFFFAAKAAIKDLCRFQVGGDVNSGYRYYAGYSRIMDFTAFQKLAYDPLYFVSDSSCSNRHIINTYKYSLSTFSN